MENKNDKTLIGGRWHYQKQEQEGDCHGHPMLKLWMLAQPTAQAGAHVHQPPQAPTGEDKANGCSM